MKRVFGAEFADCRATSGVVANLAIYSVFSDPGDYMILHPYLWWSYFTWVRKNIPGIDRVTGIWIESQNIIPFKGGGGGRNDHRCRCNEEKIEEMARSGKTPKLGMFGGSLFLSSSYKGIG